MSASDTPKRSMRTPLGRVRNLGAAHSGTGDFWRQRMTGVALYVGTLLLAWWLIAAASGPAAYANVQAFTSSFIGRLIVFGYTWALMHHMLSGIRHFVWDLGFGFKANEREALTWGALIGGIVLTVLIWIIAYAIGGVR